MAIYIGTDGNDSKRGTGGDDTMDGRAGNDVLVGALGDDTIYGGVGNDRLEGSEGDDTLYGGDGADRIRGDVGDDWVDAGAGDDVILSPTVGDRVYGGDGDDLISAGMSDILGGIVDGGAGVDTVSFPLDFIISFGPRFTATTGRLEWTNIEHIAEGSGVQAMNGENCVLDLSRFVAPSLATDSLFITGGTGADRVRGGAERDIMSGQTGNDVLCGGGGNDVLNGGRGNDALNGADGIDMVTLGEDTGDLRGWTASLTRGLAVATGETDRLSGFENVHGSNGDDVIAGNALANQLNGSDGDDRLAGADGNDVLIDGLGYDTMTGEAGADIFYATYRDGGAVKRDAVMDFSQAQGDRIHLVLDDPSRPGFQSLTFIGQAAFSGVADELRFSTANGNTFLQADLDGDAQADYVMRLKGAIVLTAADLILSSAAAPVHAAGPAMAFGDHALLPLA